MHTDGGSMSLHFDAVERQGEEEQSKARQTDSNFHESDEPPEVSLDPGRERLAAVNSHHPGDADIAFGKHESHRKSGYNAYCKVSN
jgi:hypothetical protein